MKEDKKEANRKEKSLDKQKTRKAQFGFYFSCITRDLQICVKGSGYKIGHVYSCNF